MHTYVHLCMYLGVKPGGGMGAGLVQVSECSLTLGGWCSAMPPNGNTSQIQRAKPGYVPKRDHGCCGHKREGRIERP